MKATKRRGAWPSATPEIAAAIVRKARAGDPIAKAMIVNAVAKEPAARSDFQRALVKLAVSQLDVDASHAT
jgi:hypothetical protein